MPGHTIAMSSYAGNIYSLDDFYSISSGLATLETTLFVYNSSLLEQNSAEGQLWEPVRVMVANRLGRGGEEGQGKRMEGKGDDSSVCPASLGLLQALEAVFLIGTRQT